MDQLSDDFLKSGALLSLDADRVAVGWGNVIARSGPFAELCFYAPDFFLEDPRPWKVFQTARVFPRKHLIEFLREFEWEAAPVFSWAPPSEAGFFRSFENLQNTIARGELKKGVPVVFEKASARMTPARLTPMLLSLLGRERGRVYGYWTEEEGILGLTPEDLFVQGEGGKLQTMALAGTYPTGASAEGLLNDSKERAEHQWVIDGIRSALSPFGTVSVGETAVVELPTLMHLRTPIELVPSRQFAFMDYVEALHPTAALGAFPRETGARWLRIEDDGVGRGRFGAPFGVHAPSGPSACVVSIRNVQWKGTEARLGSGCGVISASLAQREWSELALKREAVKRNFGW